MSFYENLKRVCYERGTTPTSILKKMGIPTSRVGTWKKGGIPKQDVIVALAQEIGCTVMDLFWSEADTARLEAAAEVEREIEAARVADDDEKDLIELFRKLNRRDRHAFMNMIYEFENRLEDRDA